ncbi:MAG: antiporter [Peptoniphilaceae bacterium]|nr:antiporter [Peptoniphilaceae bacterium]MDY6085232.1 antiporter [Peptoniphilaceae bacterium]
MFLSWRSITEVLFLFLAPIGLMAGKTFVNNVKKNGLSFLFIAILTCIVGGILIVFVSQFMGIPIELALGLGTGALTSTAMLGTVTSLTPSPLPGVGYGISYVVGLVGVVLLVQLVPKMLHADRVAENEKLTVPESKTALSKESQKQLIDFEPHGLFGIALAIVLGVLIGSFTIPVGPSIKISLGNGGGALIAGIILGHFGHIGPVNFTYEKRNMELVRDLGLAFFLMQAGANAGAGFVEVVSQYGIKLFFAGVIITLGSSIASFLMAYRLFKLPLFGALGTTTGSMTSAPSLGALLEVTQDNRVSNYYAATQPVATVFLVFMPQLIWMFFGPK